MKTEAFFLNEKKFSFGAHEVSCASDEVLIEVEAFGLNYAEVMARRGLYRDAPPAPAVLGYEVVGRIVDCGLSTDSSLLGQRVMAFTRFGGYARHVVSKADAIIPVGNQAAIELLALCTQGVTAFYMAKFLAPVRPGDRVLIHAAGGGVGSLLIQLAKDAGAMVIAKVGSDHKIETCQKLGADSVIQYKHGDYEMALKQILGEEKLDVSFNPVGGRSAKQDFRLMGAGGRLVLFGGSELGQAKFGFFSKLNFVRKMGLLLPIGLMMSSRSILGVNMLRIADQKPLVLKYCLDEVFKLYMEGKLKPLPGRLFTHTQFDEAHQLLESGESVGKIAVSF